MLCHPDVMKCWTSRLQNLRIIFSRLPQRTLWKYLGWQLKSFSSLLPCNHCGDEAFFHNYWPVLIPPCLQWLCGYSNTSKSEKPDYGTKDSQFSGINSTGRWSDVCSCWSCINNFTSFCAGNVLPASDSQRFDCRCSKGMKNNKNMLLEWKDLIQNLRI